jgi:predicted metalloprotease
MLGITLRVAVANQHNPSGSNGRSVRVELQADCLAGVWVHSTNLRGLLQSGDLDEVLAAAAAVGDAFLQQLSTDQIEPETWTHGSSAQRQHCLAAGFDSGKPSACDTFSSSIRAGGSAVTGSAAVATVVRTSATAGPPVSRFHPACAAPGARRAWSG